MQYFSKRKFLNGLITYYTRFGGMCIMEWRIKQKRRMKLISKYLNLKLIWFQANFVVSWPLFSLRYDLATFPAGKSCLLTPWWNRSECKVLFVYYFWLRIRTLSLSDVDATRRTLLALEWCGILLLSHMELLLMSSETQNRQYSDMPPSAGRASAEYP